MKHTRIFLAGLLLTGASISSLHAQNVWGATTTPTYTEDDVEIGGGLGIGVSRLFMTQNLSMGTPIPDLVIDHVESPFTSGPNYLELTTQIIGTGGTPGPIGIIDAINGNGWLGILQPNPTEPLDVAGNGLIEQALTVGTNAAIGANLTVNNAAVIGQSYTTGSPVTLSTPGLSTHEYSLYVANGILTEKVKVALSNDATNWSDFVFNKDYSLMPLGKLADYINANKHLPQVPSANEVAKDGIDLGSMDAKLLQKIEELTLYAIEQQKEIDELKKQVGTDRK